MLGNKIRFYDITVLIIVVSCLVSCKKQSDPEEQIILPISPPTPGVTPKPFPKDCTTPYIITTWTELNKVRENLCGNYILGNDIILPDGHNWLPIGPIFTGNFDGAGHIVKNLYIERLETDYIGLFAYNAGNIKNIGLELSDKGVFGKTIVGSLIGANTGTVSGAVTDKGGAVIGRLQVGGLVGLNGGTVYGYSTVTVRALGLAGGLIGDNAKTIGQLGGTTPLAVGYATGVVEGTSTTSGGIGGLTGHNEGVVIGYALGNVSGPGIVGGLVGLNEGPAYGYARGNVARKYNVTINRFGLLIGQTDNGEVVGYISGRADESKFENIRKEDVTGYNGFAAVSISTKTRQSDFEESLYNTLVFGNTIGEWTFHNGRWPTINLPNEAIFTKEPLQATAP